MFSPHHVSGVGCHMSSVIFSPDKVVGLVGGGSVIQGAYPVQFLTASLAFLASKSGGKPGIPGPAGETAREHPSPAVELPWLPPPWPTSVSLPHLGRLILTTKSRPSNLSSFTVGKFQSQPSNQDFLESRDVWWEYLMVRRTWKQGSSEN